MNLLPTRCAEVLALRRRSFGTLNCSPCFISSSGGVREVTGTGGGRAVVRRESPS